MAEQQDKEDAVEVVIEDAAPETEGKEEAKVEAKAPEKAEESKAEPEKDELEQQSESVRKRIDKLTYRLREAERREQAAIEFAQSLKGEVDTYKTKAETLDKSLVQEFDNRLKVQETLTKDKLKTAIDMNDVDAQIEAQRMLANLAVENERLRAQRFRQEQEAAAPRRPEPTYAPPPQQEVRPDPKAQSWADRNQWFGNDEVMTLAAFNFHKKLVESEGFDPTSDDYYGELDRRIRNEFPHKFQQAKPQASSPVASARPSSRSEGKKQVRLTPSQVAIANRLGVSLESYARQIQKLQG
jgi:hypothetical protein